MLESVVTEFFGGKKSLFNHVSLAYVLCFVVVICFCFLLCSFVFEFGGKGKSVYQGD
jgi:cation transporter-like permease